MDEIDERRTEEKSIAGFVLSILSLVCIFMLPLAGLIMGIIGIRKAKTDAYPNATLTMSIVGVVVNGFLMLLFIPVCGFAMLV